MGAGSTISGTAGSIRPLAQSDVDAVVALDAAAGGMRREDFFRKRWRAMQVDPDSCIAIVAGNGAGAEGFALAHILTGEFGGDQRFAILDGFAVDPARRHSGVGGALIAALKDEARRRGCTEIRTQCEWPRQDLLGFLAAQGFSPAPVLVLERDLEND